MFKKLHRSMRHLFSVALFICLAVMLTSTHKVFAGDNVWTPLGLYGVRVVDIAVSPHNNLIVFAGTSGAGGLYRSTDGGATWESVLPGTWSWHERVLFDPNHTNILYFYTDNYYKSIDAGNNWTQISLPLQFVSAADISPLDGTLYVSAYSLTTWGDILDQAIFRSSDGGQSWTRLSYPTASGLRSLTAMIVAPSAPHILYAASSNDRGIFKSMDHGDTWQSIDTVFGLAPIVYSLAVDPYNANLLYIGTEGDSIFRSNDGGLSWIPIGSGLETNCIWDILIDPGNQQIIYIGGGTPNSFPSTPGIPGVYRSLDNTGNSWAPMMDGMGSRAIMSMAFDKSSPQTIYAGTDGSGVWKYTVVSGTNDYSISVNQGALFTNQVNVTLSLVAPPGTNQMMISNDGGFAGASWEPFAVQKPWTIPTIGSYVIPRIVYAKFRTSGLISGLYQDDIVLDVTPPTGSIEITNAMDNLMAIKQSHLILPIFDPTEGHDNIVYLPMITKNYRAGFTVVNLILTSNDDLSGVDRMLIANNASFTDAEWVPFSPNFEWWVPDEGETTVYARYRDWAGNQSVSYSANFTP